MASEIKMLESELKEYQDIKAAMIANTNGKTVDQLKRNNDKLKAQAATALKQKEIWKRKAEQSDDKAKRLTDPLN